MPRFSAAIFVFLFIALLSLAGVGLVMLGGPILTHGRMSEHSDGTIIRINAGMDFVLRTASGQQIHFACGGRCPSQLSHMQRHYVEKAHTDVYFVREANNVLMAVDVD
ncbi:MAG TPA: hypothetical protein VKR06_25525 [Ktedonosporobacter sp.]|nr:hypothetical protein [Ktedonosporobacter sp.]